ncbi:Zn(2)-C6 fungal-type domain-containing protein [Mycena chlorophos]|uniref:Zn(2)-C6 fungal-type domain-containing protein n=1 Tax=Mycena chlorophos TaxID=658473 RepID=A0A8H6S4Q2_MYCCL|nr:Zn(2)-C6 fungal-type domain-containing protein [Mycena chlorophos]
MATSTNPPQSDSQRRDAAKSGPSRPPPKQKRTKHACDACRAKKRACDGVAPGPAGTTTTSSSSGKKCTPCTTENVPCVFSAEKPRARPSYLGVLEGRLERNQEYLKMLESQTREGPAGGVDEPFAFRLPAAPTSSASQHGHSDAAARSPGPGVELAALTIRSMNTPAPMTTHEDLGHVDLIEYMDGLPPGTEYKQRLHGKSSSARILKVAAMLRQEYEERRLPWDKVRDRYWRYNPLATCPGRVDHVTFPPPDLLAELIDLYFTHKNIYLPVLHRPTFERAVTHGLHRTDQTFASVVMLVCAIAARYSADPRVAAGPGEDTLGCGYEFFRQVNMTIDHVFEKPRLEQLQIYCLAAVFQECSAHSVWSLVGIGIRMAQDAGAHLKPPNSTGKRSVEGELWKRCFWALVCLERMVCTGLGRPASTSVEAFDAELPLECDDEYWEITPGLSASLAFTQPAGRPALAAYFVALVKLSNIWGVGLKMLYPLKHGRYLLSYRDPAWESRILAELDVALAQWAEDLPEHLRWYSHSPLRDRDDRIFHQCATLHAYYCTVQITLHRPFIPTFTKEAGGQQAEMNGIHMPSLAVCTNAARSFSHVAEALTRRQPNPVPMPSLVSLVLINALTLILNIWSGKHTGLPPELNSSVDEVRMCMQLLKGCEARWQSAGLFWDLLHELVALTQQSVGTPDSSSTSAVSAASSPNSSSSSSSKKRSHASAPTAPKPAGSRVVLTPFVGDAQRYVPAEPPSQAEADPRATRPPIPAPATASHNDDIVMSSTSSWYPTGESAAPLGSPDFLVQGAAYAYAAWPGHPPPPVRQQEQEHQATTEQLQDPDPEAALRIAEIARVWAGAPATLEPDDWTMYLQSITQGGFQ